MAIPTSEFQLKGIEKAAILFLSLGEERGAEMMKSLENNEIAALTRAMSNLGPIPAEVVEGVLREFSQIVDGNAGVIGNLAIAERMLERILPHEDVVNMLEDIRGPLSRRNTWENFAGLNEQTIANYIRVEHEQTIAAILSQLNPDVVAKVLQFIGGDRMADISHRMIKMGAVSRSVLEQIEDAVRHDFLSSATRRSGSDPFQKLADMFNKMDAEYFEELSTKLEAAAPVEFAAIKQRMFTFDDLVRLSPQDLSMVIRRATQEGNIITLALRGSRKPVRDAFMAAMTIRTREMVQEEMNNMGLVRSRDARDAQARIVDITNELAREQLIRIPNEGDMMI
jgi:flagellar motor switch protein FliG